MSGNVSRAEFLLKAFSLIMLYIEDPLEIARLSCVSIALHEVSSCEFIWKNFCLIRWPSIANSSKIRDVAERIGFRTFYSAIRGHPVSILNFEVLDTPWTGLLFMVDVSFDNRSIASEIFEEQLLTEEKDTFVIHLKFGGTYFTMENNARHEGSCILSRQSEHGRISGILEAGVRMNCVMIRELNPSFGNLVSERDFLGMDCSENESSNWELIYARQTRAWAHTSAGGASLGKRVQQQSLFLIEVSLQITAISSGGMKLNRGEVTISFK